MPVPSRNESMPPCSMPCDDFRFCFRHNHLGPLDCFRISDYSRALARHISLKIYNDADDVLFGTQHIFSVSYRQFSKNHQRSVRILVKIHQFCKVLFKNRKCRIQVESYLIMLCAVLKLPRYLKSDRSDIHRRPKGHHMMRPSARSFNTSCLDHWQICRVRQSVLHNTPPMYQIL